MGHHSIYIINVRGLKPADLPKNAVYVGRPVGGWPASPLGNPFVINEQHNRAMVIALYETWLNNQTNHNTRATNELKRLRALAANGPLILACWCAPQACHAEIIRKAILNETNC